MARDRGVFRFAPLGGKTFQEVGPDRGELPDSVAVLAEDGRLLTRSEAVLYILGRLGGIWGMLAAVGGVIPARVRDAVYDWVARNRRRWFGNASGVCPAVPPEWRWRLLA